MTSLHVRTRELVGSTPQPDLASARRDVVRSGWPHYDEDEIAAVAEVLRSGRVNSLHHGDRCRAFESALAASCHMPYALALANGTLALELAMRSLGIGAGDEVIVSPRTFIASAACIVPTGAIPVFADVDPVSQNITTESIRQVLTERTRAIIAVHLAGWPCAMNEIMAVARAHDLKVIEDCAQAPGATYNGQPVGGFGDAAAFSFCTDKIISTGGEGGMLLLRDEAVWLRAWSYKDHGKDYRRTTRPTGKHVFCWLHDSFGSNYRMTEMQAAIGLQQLVKLPGWLAARRRNASIMNQVLDGQPALRLTRPPDDIGHAYYKYYAFVRPERLRPGWSRDRIVEEVNDAGVPCFSGTCGEVYLERAFTTAKLGPAAPLPNAAHLGAASLMFPIDPTLGSDAVHRMASVAREVMEDATRGG